ncbi:hypothetical protein D3C80_1951290 [compost metagenome]
MGVMVTVMMVSMLRKIWRMERPSMTPISLKKYFFTVSIYFPSFLPTIARNMSFKLGCFSMYSTFAGGNSCFRSASVPEAIIFPSCRMAI